MQSSWPPALNKPLYVYLDSVKKIFKVKPKEEKADSSFLCEMMDEDDHKIWEKHREKLVSPEYDSYRYHILLNNNYLWDYNYDIIENKVKTLRRVSDIEESEEDSGSRSTERARKGSHEKSFEENRASSDRSRKGSYEKSFEEETETDTPSLKNPSISPLISKSGVTHSIGKTQIDYVQNKSNLYWLAHINDKLFLEDEINEKIKELQIKKQELITTNLGRNFFSFFSNTELKKIEYCSIIPESDSNFNVGTYKHCIKLMTTVSQDKMNLYKSLITPNLDKTLKQIRKGKDLLIVNDLNTTKNTLINSQNIENMEAIKITTWINDNLIRYRKSGDSSSEFKSLLPELVHFIVRGHIHIARAGIDIDDYVRREDLPLMSFFKKDGKKVVDDPYNTGYDMENIEQIENIGLGWDADYEEDEPYEFTEFKNVLGNPIDSTSLAKELVGMKHLDPSNHVIKKMEEIEVLLGMEYFIALNPEPEHSLFILKRLIVAWYADPELLISIRKIKYLVNHYRARSDVNINKNILPTLPMIVIYLRYGVRFFSMALSKINYYFTNYVYLGWDRNMPDYYIRHNNLVYYANGSTDVKRYLDKTGNSSDYYKKFTPNPRGELRYGQMSVTYVPSDDYNERIRQKDSVITYVENNKTTEQK
jgi:hypothetical protein